MNLTIQFLHYRYGDDAGGSIACVYTHLKGTGKGYVIFDNRPVWGNDICGCQGSSSLGN